MFGLNSAQGRLGIATTSDLYEPEKLDIQAMTGSRDFEIAAVALGSQAAYVLVSDYCVA